jgi:hypothetical protein
LERRENDDGDDGDDNDNGPPARGEVVPNARFSEEAFTSTSTGCAREAKEKWEVWNACPLNSPKIETMLLTASVYNYGTLRQK